MAKVWIALLLLAQLVFASADTFFAEGSPVHEDFDNTPFEQRSGYIGSGLLGQNYRVNDGWGNQNTGNDNRAPVMVLAPAVNTYHSENTYQKNNGAAESTYNNNQNSYQQNAGASMSTYNNNQNTYQQNAGSAVSTYNNNNQNNANNYNTGSAYVAPAVTVQKTEYKPYVAPYVAPAVAVQAPYVAPVNSYRVEHTYQQNGFQGWNSQNNVMNNNAGSGYTAPAVTVQKTEYKPYVAPYVAPAVTMHTEYKAPVLTYNRVEEKPYVAPYVAPVTYNRVEQKPYVAPVTTYNQVDVLKPVHPFQTAVTFNNNAFKGWSSQSNFNEGSRYAAPANNYLRVQEHTYNTEYKPYVAPYVAPASTYVAPVSTYKATYTAPVSEYKAPYVAAPTYTTVNRVNEYKPVTSNYQGWNSQATVSAYTPAVVSTFKAPAVSEYKPTYVAPVSTYKATYVAPVSEYKAPYVAPYTTTVNRVNEYKPVTSNYQGWNSAAPAQTYQANTFVAAAPARVEYNRQTYTAPATTYTATTYKTNNAYNNGNPYSSGNANNNGNAYSTNGAYNSGNAYMNAYKPGYTAAAPYVASTTYIAPAPVASSTYTTANNYNTNAYAVAPATVSTFKAVETYRAPAAVDTYRAPVAVDTYRAPVAVDTYRAPVAVDTYRAPVTVTTNAYNGPFVGSAFSQPYNNNNGWGSNGRSDVPFPEESHP